MFREKRLFNEIKDFEKRSKESILWLRLTKPEIGLYEEKDFLIQEATELMKIFGAILQKSKDK